MNEGEKLLFWPNDKKFRFLKWQFDAVVAGERKYMQISELRFIDAKADIFQWPTDSVCTDHSAHLTTGSTGVWYTKEMGHECAEKLLDLSVETKFCCCYNNKLPFFITFDLQTKCLDLSKFNRYQWYTCNDDAACPDRTPTSWQLFISNDSVKWDLLDKVENFTAPVANFTLAYTSGRIA